MHCTCKTLLSGVFALPSSRLLAPPPAFLVPAFSEQTSSFSTFAARLARKDGNPNRRESALYRSGLNRRHNRLPPKGPEAARRSTLLPNLPKPVLDRSRRSAVEVDEDHGLWDFFPTDRKFMATPEEMHAHGRAWAVPELRRKDWTDLHKLWWTCIKELNRLKTYASERERIANLYGGSESDGRKSAIKITMKHIRLVLTERWYAFENARNVAMDDPEIDLYANINKGETGYLKEEPPVEPDVNEETVHEYIARQEREKAEAQEQARAQS